MTEEQVKSQMKARLTIKIVNKLMERFDEDCSCNNLVQNILDCMKKEAAVTIAGDGYCYFRSFCVALQLYYVLKEEEPRPRIY